MSSNIFTRLFQAISATEEKLARIEAALAQLEWGGGGGGGGGGNATIEDYESDKFYKRNTLVVDPNTETVYRTLPRDGFTSTTLEQDLAANPPRLKLVGYESQFVTFNHPPTQGEIDALPEDALVAIYSPQDDPYTPALSSDHVVDD